MLSIISLLLSGVLSGGATGLLGVLLQRYFDLKNKQQDVEVLKLNLANNIELSKMESDRLKVRMDAELDIETEKSDAAILQASYQNDQAAYVDKESMRKKGWVANTVLLMMGIVDFTRGILRPGMTIYLCFLVSAMFMWAKGLAEAYGISMTSEQVVDLITQIIATILYVFTTVTLWWFGTRPPKNKNDA